LTNITEVISSVYNTGLKVCLKCNWTLLLVFSFSGFEGGNGFCIPGLSYVI
jgi:hypothetical protein